MSLWNIKNLESPPITTYKTKQRDVDIKKLKKILREALNGFKIQTLNLNPEAAHISRWIYRMKTKFRSDKGLKCVEKINRTLLQLLRINFNETVKNFQDMVPNSYSQVNYLPTLNNLHFVMVRIQGVAKLMIRMIELSKCAAEFFQDRIERGHFWNVSLICLASIARVFKISKEYTKILCKLYNQLLPFTNVLKNVSFNWLPIDYDLPSDLNEWLNADELLEDITELKPKVVLPPIFNLLNAEEDGDDIIAEQNTSIKPEQDDSRVNELTTINSVIVVSATEEDIGEAVETKPINKKIKQKKTANSIKSINRIKSLKDLINFQNQLNQNSLKCFENVDTLKCRILQNKLTKLIKKGGKNKNQLNEVLEKAREIIKSFLL